MNITVNDVILCQAKWGNAIKEISLTYLNKGDYIYIAHRAISELYAYDHANVLFKPTKAFDNPFRFTYEGALSYFVGGNVVEGGHEEDSGFAINGGMGWSDVKFVNHQIDITDNVAIAMGAYMFTCATSKRTVNVEYTFGYKRNKDGNIRIFLHHSSLPYCKE